MAWSNQIWYDQVIYWNINVSQLDFFDRNKESNLKIPREEIGGQSGKFSRFKGEILDKF